VRNWQDQVMALTRSSDSKLMQFQVVALLASNGKTKQQQNKAAAKQSSSKERQQQDQAVALLEMKVPAAEATTAKHQHSNAQ